MISKTAKMFSVVIPTYTGQDTISACVNSILDQNDLQFCKEIIIVIDGPNEKLREKVNSFRPACHIKKIKYTIIQFEENKGRLEARLAGAQAADTSHVLYIDDRTMMADGYLSSILSRHEDAIMPVVEEASHPNVMALAMSRLRHVLYRRDKKIDSSSRYVNEYNFDDLPKGTTSFWIDRKVFIDVSELIKAQTTDVKTVSDDTRILREIVNRGIQIYRDDEALLLYQPRQKLSDELSHTYKRGPLFIDYYLRPGTKYFPFLVGFYVGILLLIVVAIFWWQTTVAIVVAGLVGCMLLSIRLAHSGSEVVRVFAGLVLTFAAFFAGLLVGLAKKVINR